MPAVQAKPESGRSERRELHPPTPFRKSFRSMILASIMGAGGCTMAALTRHYCMNAVIGANEAFPTTDASSLVE